MAAEGLKVITYAFKQIKIEDFNHLMQSCDPECEAFRNQLEVDLIYVATFGLADPLREDIFKTVYSIKYGHSQSFEVKKSSSLSVNIRMITGDHLETAK